MIVERIFISAKDIQGLTGCSEKTSYTKLTQIKDSLQKKPHQNLTIKDYCDYEGVCINEVKEALGIARVIR